ncbi:MAG: hypothetical protein ACMUIA_11805 [bacterium]
MEKKILHKNILKRRIIIYEILGFGITIAVIWVDEMFDIPYRFFGMMFGVEKTPVNLMESALETAFILVLFMVIIFFTQRCLERIKLLEGFLRVCTFCKKIRVGDQWIPIDTYIQAHSETTFSHGLCPECMKKHYGEAVKT